jgi:thiamine pyrophosphokinase
MRAVIFANGVIPDPGREAALWIRRGDLVVAADGGSSHASGAGVAPHVVIGDLDSMPEDRLQGLRDTGTRFVTFVEDKDETDLELALAWAVKQPDVEEIIVLGAFGGRPDQALANLLLLAHPALQGGAGPDRTRCRVLMVDGAWAVRLIRGGEHVVLNGGRGDRVSLIPLGGSAVGVTTFGLRFPLCDETLVFGPARGVSNRLEAVAATITLREGLLWCFHECDISAAQE